MIRTCPSCGQKNRVESAHLHQVARCGACKTTLGAVAEPIDVDTALFDDIVQNAKVPILVDFWAEWCPPCRRAAPEVKKTAAQTTGRALVLKVDTEKSPDLGARYHVVSIPNFVVFNEWRLVFQQPGLVGSDQMTRWLENAETVKT